MKKTLSFNIPDYLTVEQYAKMGSNFDGKVEKMVNIISALTGYDTQEVQTWSLDSLNKVFEQYKGLADAKNEFHSIIEWNGTLYGYSDIKSMNLGCYIDLENLSKDLSKNLHKIGALLYRPITKHRFGTINFIVKQKLKMANNDVENVFDWYEIEEYDVKKRKDREEEFKQFPVHILLGAVSFFLSTASLYLNTTAYSQDQIQKTMMTTTEKNLMESLLESIGVGGGLSTTSLSPIYSKLQGTSQSQMLTS